MKAALVVENDPIADADFRLAAVGVAFEIDVLVFQRASRLKLGSCSGTHPSRG